ncbi:tape measure protein [Maritalea porphyrae]|uniref:tape measure protein n=1 Tax=Maritalea porphyrae TaxID=880732 RepID=UPI0022AF85B3|nr:tape measure protein [Maritalea porphyrae]MCZ4273301.1 tape measure protein [Maritalea porphyrae]
MSMKLGIVAEFTDRATKRMRRFLKFNEKMERLNKTQAKLQKASSVAQTKSNKTTTKVAQQTQNLARAQSRVKASAQQAYQAVVKGAQSAGRSIAKLHRQSLDLAKHGLGNIKNGLGKVGKGAMIAGGLLASMWAGSALAAGSMVDVASQFEKFETVLISSTGSAEGAKKAMGWVTTFAVSTPYELDQVTEAFVQLKNYGIDPTDGTLRTLGDTSAAMGKNLGDAVEALADAVTGENERLKSFGITAKKSGDLITYSYTNAAGEAMKATAKASDRANIQMTLMDIFNEKYAGSMERLSATWAGMMANLADLWMKFQLMIMDAGLFDWMKGKLKLVLDTITQMESDGSLKVWATEIASAIQTSLESAWEFANRAIDIISQLSDHLGSAAEFVGGWENLAMVLGGMVFGPALVATAAGLIQIATGLAALGAALMANPIMLAIAAIALGVYLIYANWDAIKPYFEAIWNGILHAAQVAWDWLKQAFEWTPLGQITKNWEPIAQAMSGPIDAAKSAIASAWEGIKSIMKVDWAALIGNIEIPSFDEAIANIQWFFSLEWLPDWEWPEIPMPELPDIGGMISDLSAKTSEAWKGLTGIFGGQDAVTIAATDPASIERATQAANKLKAAMDGVSGVNVSPALDRLNQVRAAGEALPDTMQIVVDRIGNVLGRINFAHHGERMMETIASGMRAKSHLLVSAMRDVTKQLRDHLPSSPAKTGPLSDIHRLKFSETIARSIKPGPMVKAMRQAAAATLAAASISAPALASTPTLVSPPQSVAARPSSQAQANGASKGANYSFTLAPVIHVGEGSNASAEDIVDKLSEIMPDLIEKIKRELKDDERLEF